MERGNHCRFIPGDPNKRAMSANCTQDTVVDSDITHRKIYDFILAVHNSIQGVSRPTRYTLLL